MSYLRVGFELTFSTAVARRDFLRAAVFLCKMPLETALSINLYAFCNAACADLASAVLTESSTSLRRERIADFQALLRARLRSAVSTLLMADLMLGTIRYFQDLSDDNGRVF